MHQSLRAAAWVVATENRGKLAEMRALLAGVAPALLALSDLPPVTLPPEGDDYERNAVAKARAVAVASRLPAVADDSGLEVDALGGRPGVRSARYGGPGLSDAERVAKLLRELAGAGPATRTARFVCVVSLVTPEGEVLSARGVCAGRILVSPQGGSGFGYDPIFAPDPLSLSMAQLSADVKNAISHRGRALGVLRSFLAGSPNSPECRHGSGSMISGASPSSAVSKKCRR